MSYRWNEFLCIWLVTYRLRSDLGFHQDSIYGVWTLLFLGTTPKRIAFAGRIVGHSQPVGLHTQIVSQQWFWERALWPSRSNDSLLMHIILIVCSSTWCQSGYVRSCLLTLWTPFNVSGTFCSIHNRAQIQMLLVRRHRITNTRSHQPREKFVWRIPQVSFSLIRVIFVIWGILSLFKPQLQFWPRQIVSRVAYVGASLKG